MTDAKVLDPILIQTLSKQGIDVNRVALWRDYAPHVRGKGFSPYARTYLDTLGSKQFAVISGLPGCDAYGQEHELAWTDKNGLISNGNNIFHAVIDKGSLVLMALSEQPYGIKSNDTMTFHPQLFIGGVEVKPTSDTPRLLDGDPVNENYAKNTLEWDYGVCLRRIRIIEGRFLGSWVFVTAPKGDVLIEYNRSGKLCLCLQYAQGDDTEFIPKAYFDEATEWPVIIDDSATFYPDAHPETSSVDGELYHSVAAGASWATLRDGAGTYAVPTATLGYVGMTSDDETDKWANIERCVFLFDTSSLAGRTVISATLSIRGYSKADGLSCTPDINIYSSNPASNTNLVAGDYDSLGTAAFCDTAITYTGFNTSGYNDFVLNASGLAAINTSGISKFGARNTNYDVANSAPSWAASKSSRFRMCYAEYGAGYQPKLVVTYTQGAMDKSSSDAGSGIETVIPGNPIVIMSSAEAGSASESLGSRDLGQSEMGSGIDIASLLSALAGEEIGSATEAALFIAALFQADAALGSELSWMLKDAVSGDVGSAREALKLLIKTASATADGRLFESAGQGKIPSQKREMPSGQSRMPSKGVNI